MRLSDKRPRLGVSPLGFGLSGGWIWRCFLYWVWASLNLKVSFIGCFRPVAGERDILKAQEITKEKDL